MPQNSVLLVVPTVQSEEDTSNPPCKSYEASQTLKSIVCGIQPASDAISDLRFDPLSLLQAIHADTPQEPSSSDSLPQHDSALPSSSTNQSAVSESSASTSDSTAPRSPDSVWNKCQKPEDTHSFEEFDDAMMDIVRDILRRRKILRGARERLMASVMNPVTLQTETERFYTVRDRIALDMKETSEFVDAHLAHAHRFIDAPRASSEMDATAGCCFYNITQLESLLTKAGYVYDPPPPPPRSTDSSAAYSDPKYTSIADAMNRRTFDIKSVGTIAEDHQFALIESLEACGLCEEMSKRLRYIFTYMNETRHF